MVRVIAIQGTVTNLNMTLAGGLGATHLVTYTTRQPIDGETDGVEYHFIKPVYFTKLMTEDFFASVSIFEGNYYGIPRSIENIDEPTCLLVVPGHISYLRKTYGADLIVLGAVMPWYYIEATARNSRVRGINLESLKDDHSTQLEHLDYCDLIINVSDSNHLQVGKILGNINGLILQRGVKG